MSKFWKVFTLLTFVLAAAGVLLGLIALIGAKQGATLTCGDLGLSELLGSDNITKVAFHFNQLEKVVFSDADLIAKIPQIFKGITFVKRPKVEYEGFLSLSIKTKTKTYAFVLYGGVINYQGVYYNVSKNLNAAFEEIINTAIERQGAGVLCRGCLSAVAAFNRCLS